MINYKIDQWFVRVEPAKSTRIWLSGPKTQEEQDKRTCQDIKESIERHIDDYSDVVIDNDGHYECSFCGYTNADKDDYECCEDSIAEHENLIAKARELTE